MKKIFKLAMIMVALFSLKAMAQQMPQPQQLPLDPNVKHGVLKNGLTYYVLHNEEPKNRANFYIAQKVGSTLETPEQLGLAHFLEHMAFNGTTTYPGKNLLNYLQTKGIRFGQDINAYTNFDETVYNIDNVPTTDRPLMDSVLLALRDWSGSILLEEAEIESERGVIREEWRQRNNAQWRQFEYVLPHIFQEYQYQQMPIGKMDIVMNFKPKAIRDYYKKWYRPDQQGIIVVGDFDAEEMEKKVIEIFSTIPMPENAAERTYASVSDNETPIYCSFSDPELQTNTIRISFKKDVLPAQYKNTDMGYIQNDVMMQLIVSMINERLSEYAHDANCAYAYAGCMFGKFYVAKTKDSFDLIVVPKDNPQTALASAMSVVARACKTGFTQGEIERARDKVIANLDRAYNEKDKTSNEVLAEGFIENFINNEPAPGIEFRRMLVSQYLHAIPVEAYNQIAASIITPTNQVIVAAAPNPEMIITEETSVATIKHALEAQYEAYVDEVITEPLIASLPTPGAVKSEKKNDKFGTTEFVLSNGVKVILKTTDYAADNIGVQIYEEGGKRTFTADQAPNVLLIGDAFNNAKLGPFDVKTLRKYLAGKKVDLTFDIGNFTNYFEGGSTVKDFKTLMELIYTAFTNIGGDKASYDTQIDQARVLMSNYEKDPRFIFNQHVNKAQYNGNPLKMDATVNTINSADYDTMINMIKEMTANAADYTFIFTGNIDAETLRPLLEQYVATLPAGKKTKKVKTVSGLAVVSGIINDDYNQPMQVESVNVYDVISGKNLKFNTPNMVKISLVGDLLDMMYVETLREEEGGTYGAQTHSAFYPGYNQWEIIYTFVTNPEQQKSLRERAYNELLQLLQNGAKEDHFNKVKEAALRQLEIQEKSNKYWSANLLNVERGIDTITGYREALESLTLAEMNEFMKNLYDGKNRIEVVMNGVKE